MVDRSARARLPRAENPRKSPPPSRRKPRPTYRPAVNCAGAPDELVFAERRSRVEGSQTVPAEEVLALAELAHGIGCRLRPSDPCTALPWFRDAAAYSAFGLAAAGWGDATAPARARAMAVHNSSVEWLLRCAGSGPSDLNPAWRERLGAAGVQAATTAQERVGLPCHELWIASDFRVRNLDPVAREGLGVPVIALSRFPDRRQVPDRFFPERLRLPATVVFRPGGPLRGGEWRARTSMLDLHDPASETSTLTCDGSSVVPLAADLTTPLAHQFLNSPLNELAWGGLLRPEAYSDVTGVFMSGPYRPGKIPVLFVHGLWSSPGTWLLMANRLQEDPFIRDHYQFWYAYYPTGASVMVSAVRIRDTLSQLREAIDPGRVDPALDRMVVVGHSLGGVLSKQLLLHSGDELERGLFTRPFESVAMSPESRQTLSRYLYFEPEPSIRRAIFLAAPHRGSNAANQWVGRLASALIQRPTAFASLHAEILALNGRDVFQPEFQDRPPSGVDNLEWDSPILQALAKLPIPPDIPYHSVVATLVPNAPTRLRTDGVVRYESAHLEGAASEVVVRHNHFVDRTPEAAAEVHRILRLHVEIPKEAGVVPAPAGGRVIPAWAPVRCEP